MRTKKNVRDKLKTDAFFQQSSSRCPSDNQTCTIANPPTGMVRRPGIEHAMEEACKVFDVMTKSLDELSLEEQKSESVQADRANIAGTFELVDIEGTIHQADNVDEYFNRVHNDKIDALREAVDDEKKIAEGTGDRLATLSANLDEMIGQYQAFNEHVNSAVCKARLFNMEKRFGFFEQDYHQIKNQAEASAGDTVENDPPSLREMFKNPMSAEVLTGRKKKPKKHKKRDIKALLDENIRLTKLAIQDAQAINKQISDEAPTLPSLPANIVYEGESIPVEIPRAVRQSAFDLAFTCDEIHETRVDLL
ncbi:hypothetical protein MMC07_007695 [Pseudocyphellaria aurata]|nr:hypothetical protein [Pseudocyphellaria aurata]